ncbi:hypothetical protein FACS189434_00100 [Bacteroidia bacterium]|nr:hypothetical protein FACS189434_00100 [Bacteroidia bacterium]
MNKKLKEIFKQILEVNEVPETISQTNCDKWDSMRHLNLIVEIEMEFDISFEPEEIAIMKDFDSVQKMIATKLL